MQFARTMFSIFNIGIFNIINTFLVSYNNTVVQIIVFVTKVPGFHVHWQTYYLGDPRDEINRCGT